MLTEIAHLDLWSGSLCYTTGFTAKITGIVYCRFFELPDCHQVISGGAPRGSFVIQTPEIVFSEWYAWDDIKRIPNADKSGVYIIARFDQKPSDNARPDIKEVLYIGETTGRTKNIYKRLSMFFKAARVGGGVHPHSGGNTFNTLNGNDLNNLYAAAFAPTLENQTFLKLFILYVERKLIWDYIVKRGATPQCNTK